MRKHSPRNQRPCPVVDEAIHNGDTPWNYGRIDVIVACTRPRAEVLCAVAHLLTHSESYRRVSLRAH